MLHPGQPAPDFSLPDADMEMFELSSLRGRQHVVLFFYPRNGTPLCTQEAIDFSDHESDFIAEQCTVIGISRDDCLCHADFRDHHGLSVRLLSDDGGKVSHRYGVFRMLEKEGHKKLCVVRSTFIIDRNGTLRHALYDVRPKGHVAEVFQWVKDLNRTPSGSGKNSCKSPRTQSSL